MSDTSPATDEVERLEIPDQGPVKVPYIPVALDRSDLDRQIKASKGRATLLEKAGNTLERVNGIWRPAAVLQWFDVSIDKEKSRGYVHPPAGEPVCLDLGHAATFLHEARKVLIAVYTAGPEIDEAARQASAASDILEAYFIDLIGLAVLDKAARAVVGALENKVAGLGWGVGPFMSPGSVHGWDLDDQRLLAPLLPIEAIGVSIQDTAVLTPHKSIACLIGAGPDYPFKTVGTPCRVCSRSQDCTMKQSGTMPS